MAEGEEIHFSKDDKPEKKNQAQFARLKCTTPTKVKIQKGFSKVKTGGQTGGQATNQRYKTNRQWMGRQA